jgi:3-hydroxyisobutyrate dehydrogenase-like beta-hydroxyacid dehydrogenase
MANIAFIGLGVMGGAIARHLATAGHDMVVYNRTKAKASPASAMMMILPLSRFHATGHSGR